MIFSLKEIHLVDLINHLINSGSGYIEKNDYSTASNISLTLTECLKKIQFTFIMQFHLS